MRKVFKNMINRKNKFKTITLIAIFLKWLLGNKIYNIFDYKGKIPLRYYYTLSHYLHIQKQELLNEKVGEEKFLSMTMNEIFNYKL